MRPQRTCGSKYLCRRCRRVPIPLARARQPRLVCAPRVIEERRTVAIPARWLTGMRFASRVLETASMTFDSLRQSHSTLFHRPPLGRPPIHSLALCVLAVTLGTVPRSAAGAPSNIGQLSTTPIGPAADSAVSAALRSQTPYDSKRGRIFLAGSGLLFGISLALQLVTHEQRRRQCSMTTRDPVAGTSRAPDRGGSCVAANSGVIGTGIASAVGSFASIGLAAGSGWELAATSRRFNSRRQRMLLLLGASLLGLGSAGYAATRAVMAERRCNGSTCLEEQRTIDFVTRNAGMLMAASGAGLLGATARQARLSVQPLRVAGGAGLTVTVRMP